MTMHQNLRGRGFPAAWIPQQYGAIDLIIQLPQIDHPSQPSRGNHLDERRWHVQVSDGDPPTTVEIWRLQHPMMLGYMPPVSDKKVGLDLTIRPSRQGRHMPLDSVQGGDHPEAERFLPHLPQEIWPTASQAPHQAADLIVIIGEQQISKCRSVRVPRGGTELQGERRLHLPNVCLGGSSQSCGM